MAIQITKDSRYFLRVPATKLVLTSKFTEPQGAGTALEQRLHFSIRLNIIYDGTDESYLIRASVNLDLMPGNIVVCGREESCGTWNLEFDA